MRITIVHAGFAGQFGLQRLLPYSSSAYGTGWKGKKE